MIRAAHVNIVRGDTSWQSRGDIRDFRARRTGVIMTEKPERYDARQFEEPVYDRATRTSRASAPWHLFWAIVWKNSSEGSTSARRAPEHDGFFTDPTMVARVKARQVDYWRNFFDARIDRAYVDRLRVLGEVHAQIGLSLEAYFSGVSFFLTTFSTAIVDPKSKVESREKSIVAATKLVQMDTEIVVSTLSGRTSQIISEQNQALMELSTPVSMLWDDILMLPIVGIVD